MEIIEKNILKSELWRRAAINFEKAALLAECAAAWLAAGDENEAIEVLIKTGDRPQATPLLLKKKRYKEATNQARLWLNDIAKEPKRQLEEEIRALLHQAAALHLDQQPDQAQATYSKAREKLSQATKKTTPLADGKNWETLASYGVMLKRPDLIRLGYEKALATYGQTYNLQRLRCAGEYLDKVADDIYLSKELRERIAEWQPQSSMKIERERLWQALSEFTEEA